MPSARRRYRRWPTSISRRDADSASTPPPHFGDFGEVFVNRPRWAVVADFIAPTLPLPRQRRSFPRTAQQRHVTPAASQRARAIAAGALGVLAERPSSCIERQGLKKGYFDAPARRGARGEMRMPASRTRRQQKAYAAMRHSLIQFDDRFAVDTTFSSP